MSDRDTFVRNKVMAAYHVAKNFKRPLNEKALRYYKLYRSWRANRHEAGYYHADTGRANLFIPYTFSLIETVTSRTLLSLFAHTPYIGIIPDDADTTIDNAKNMEDLINYQLEEKMNIVMAMADFLKECLMYGSAFGKVGWDYRTKKIRRKEQRKILSMFPAGWETKEVEEVIADDPVFMHLDYFNVYWDVEATSLQNARYIMYEYKVPRRLLKEWEKAGLYKNIDQVKSGSGYNLDDYREQRNQVTGLTESGHGDIFSGIDADLEKVHVIEYWEDGFVHALANGDVVIRDEETPFDVMAKPFIHGKNVPVPHEFNGISDIEIIEGLQNELNSVRNQRMDNVSLIIDRMFKVRRGAHIDHDELVTGPGKFIHLDRMDDIEVLQWPDITQSSYLEEEIIKKDIQFALGIFDYAMGATPERRETATTIVSLQQAANMRFKSKLILAENMVLRELAYWMGALNQQYITEPKFIRVRDADGNEQRKMLKPQDIWGRFRFRPRGSAVEPLANSQVRTEMLIQLFGLIANRPEIDKAQFVKIIVEEMGLREVERLFTGLQGEQLEIMQQAYEQLQQNNQRADEVTAELVQKGGNPGGVTPDVMRQIMGGVAGMPQGR